MQPPRGRGQPALDINPEQVKDLAALGCTINEMCDFFHCGHTTLNNRFQSQINEGRAEMKMRLRRAQLKSALEGNPTMLIWLGKQMLGQTDQQHLNVVTEDKNKADETLLEALAGK